jgi:hypothetical protein
VNEASGVTSDTSTPSFSTIICVTLVAIADILNFSLVKNDCKENAFKRKQQNTRNFFSTRIF